MTDLVHRNHQEQDFCRVHHRYYRTLAACEWLDDRPIWINGEGPYGVLAWCGGLTITLWSMYEEALKAKSYIDANFCGHYCYKKHEIVELEL